MRTKVLICAAFLAASLASSMAQNVYSLNVVGYVNITIPAGQGTIICNPLDSNMGSPAGGGFNDITNLFTATTGNPQANSIIEAFNPVTANWGSPITYNSITHKWSSSLPLGVGQAIYYKNVSTSVATVFTFTGQVQQGTYVNNVFAKSGANMIGSPVPIGGGLTNSTTVTGLVPNANDLVEVFNGAAPGGGSWSAQSTWNSVTKKWSADYQIPPGQGFYYKNGSATATLTWTSNFTVQ
jgi:hypothetical protein